MICCSELHLCQTDVLECMSVLRLTSSPAVDSAMSILSVPHYSLIFSGTVYDHVVLQDITLTEHVWRGWKQIYGEKIWLPITYNLVCVCVCVHVCVCVLAGGLAVRFSHYQWSGISLILLNCECQIDVLFSLMFCFYTLRHWISRKFKARVSSKMSILW